jgi:hypothetical protein
VLTVNRAHNDVVRAWKQMKKAQSAARREAKEWGEDTPTESNSSEEGQVTSPP